MIKIAVGDCLERMREFESESVNCCVTSPPYFGLRDYGHAGQIGLEASPDEFISKLVQVFREVRRLLRDDGTLWLNIGDSYNNFRSQMSPGQTVHGKDKLNGKPAVTSRKRGVSILKEKDLIGIPWMLAFALRADGWYLRQDIIWSKPNPMPESVTDRCTKAHEYIFLLSKSPKYYYDREAIREPIKSTSGKTSVRRSGDSKTRSKEHWGVPHNPINAIIEYAEIKGANKRSVWTVTTKPFKGAHFATFPPDLIKPCILAGCPEGGIVLDPFGGSGTTGLVAQQQKRSAILCELNPDYALIAENRIREDSPMFSNIEKC